MKLSSQQQLLLLIIAIILGILIGGLVPALGEGLSLIGELFLRALLMLVVPLVMTSLITAVSNVGEAQQLGKIGRTTLGYYLSTTMIAVVIGICVVLIIRPGYAENEADRIALRGGEILAEAPYEIQDQTLTLKTDSFKRQYSDRFQIQLIDQPDIRGTITQSEEANTLTVTDWIDPNQDSISPKPTGLGLKIDLVANASTQTAEKREIGSVVHDLLLMLVPRNLFHSMANNEVLPLISFSLIFGIALLSLGEKAAILTQFFESLNLIIMQIVHGMMALAPLGIGALIAGRIAEAGGFIAFIPELMLLGKYTLTVILGLLVHGGIVLPLAFQGFSRYSLPLFLRNLSPSLTTAFATSSSSATLPITIDCIT
ncbi:MAG: dicarboxylate/amino acid:cation symporter, partial [Acaryochloridaceae cyanobacterium RL_2_7]|nr:dicarboxylate/amino acid:cation symporter [Acaryochloridaceae cyanobacterium RL_2_7]